MKETEKLAEDARNKRNKQSRNAKTLPPLPDKSNLQLFVGENTLLQPCAPAYPSTLPKLRRQDLINRKNQRRARRAPQQRNPTTAIQALQTMRMVERTADAQKSLPPAVRSKSGKVARLHFRLDRVGGIEGEIVAQTRARARDHALPERKAGVLLARGGLLALPKKQRQCLVAAEPGGAAACFAQ